MINKLVKKYNLNFSGDLGSVFKGMSTLLIGSVFGRIIGIISIPIVTRFYSPSDYGLLALYTSFITILAPIFTLRYVQAIPLPQKDGVAINIFSLCIKLILLWFFIISILFYLFSANIFAFFGTEILLPWWWMIPIGASGIALYEVFSLWATRKKDFKTMSKSQISQSIIGNLVKIVLGILSIKPIGLIIGQFLSQSAGITGFLFSGRKDFRAWKSKINRRNEIFVARYYREFLFYRLPSHLLMVTSIQAPLIMSALLFEKSITGQLSLAIMALSLPVALIGQAMARAFYSEIASLGKNNLNKVKSLTISLQKRLLLIGFPFVLLVAFLSEPLFAFIFGKEWVLAGKFASILAPFIMFQFTSSPLMEVINILGKQYLFLILHMIRFAGLVTIFFIIKMFDFDSETFVSIISLYLSMFYLSASLLVMYVLRKEVFNHDY